MSKTAFLHLLHQNIFPTGLTATGSEKGRIREVKWFARGHTAGTETEGGQRTAQSVVSEASSPSTS